jgi:hypothetical protein
MEDAAYWGDRDLLMATIKQISEWVGAESPTGSSDAGGEIVRVSGLE